MAQKRRRDDSDIESDQEEPRLMRFDGADKNLYDVILVVEEEKFHVSKIHLAQHSPYFSSLFFGPFAEKDKKEIELKETCIYTFQKFLEVINGVAGLTDDNITQVLKLSRQYQAPTALRACELYLMEKAGLSMKKKWDMCQEYKFEDLKKNLINKITTKDELRAIIPDDLTTLDLETTRIVLQKTLEVCEVTRTTNTQKYSVYKWAG